MRPRLLATLTIATAALLLAAPAQADFQTLYNDYRNDGLVIVGVHSPEFDFEKVPANVAAAVTRLARSAAGVRISTGPRCATSLMRPRRRRAT